MNTKITSVCDNGHADLDDYYVVEHSSVGMHGYHLTPPKEHSDWGIFSPVASNFSSRSRVDSLLELIHVVKPRHDGVAVKNPALEGINSLQRHERY